MRLFSKAALPKPLEDRLATRDWSMGTMVTNRESWAGSLSDLPTVSVTRLVNKASSDGS